MRKAIGFVLNIIIVTLIMIWFIVIVSNITMKVINKSDTMRFFNYSLYRVSSCSMTPTLNVGDIILVKKELSYQEKDVITFKTDDGTLTHRIVKINGDEIITKGDANSSADKPITEGVIEGKLVRKLGIVTWIYKQFSNKSIVLIILTVILVSFMVPNNKRYREQ